MRSADLEGSELVKIYDECERTYNWTAFYARVERIQADALAEGRRQAFEEAARDLECSGYDGLGGQIRALAHVLDRLAACEDKRR